ncbi:hypothetical protein, partial [Mesorhizobium sp. M7A.F.Ca.CA.001.11.2.1]|uniref:hypothetical protein n=1 Tax=Mesorhizobium sp. M7A.F.Ca.CA.001.11.2.1 TaxID=2496693 RepID=UPI0019D1A737
ADIGVRDRQGMVQISDFKVQVRKQPYFHRIETLISFTWARRGSTDPGIMNARCFFRPLRDQFGDATIRSLT